MTATSLPPRSLRPIRRAIAIAALGSFFGAPSMLNAAPASPLPAPARVLEMPSPAPENSHLSRLTRDEEGALYASWVTEENDRARLAFARLKGEQWSEPEVISEGTDWFVNWADFPVLAVHGGNRVAHWLRRSGEGSYDYDVVASFYDSRTGDWATPRVVNAGSTNAEHGFVAMLPLDNAGTLIAWLDGRNTKAKPQPGPMTLRAGVFGVDGSTREQWELDASVCDCCQTGAAMTPEGPVLVYRDRSAEEIRDIAIMRQVNGRWTRPQPVHSDNWQVMGCPVNGPAVAASGNALAVAWFTASGNLPRVQLALSADSGKTFTAPLQVAGSQTLGRVDLAFLANGQVVVSWVHSSQNSARVMLSRYSPDGSFIDSTAVAATSGSRRSGFPTIESIGDDVYVSWTDISAGRRVRVARVQYGPRDPKLG